MFTLVLSNKKLIYQDVAVDANSDYVDIYLQGIKKTSSAYEVTDNGTNIVIVFNESITLDPGSVVNTDFLVKGKIASR